MDTPITPLSPREGEVLRYFAQGLHGKEIARKLGENGISHRTVEIQAMNMRQKLGARTLPQAVAIGMRLGLIDPFEEAGPPPVPCG